MASLGLPKELSCEAGSIDGYLYSYLSTLLNIIWNKIDQVTFDFLTIQFNYIKSGYSNIGSSSYFNLGKVLIDELNRTITSQYAGMLNLMIIAK